MTTAPLPPLPAPMWPQSGRERPYVDAYSAANMQAYAAASRADLQAALERKDALLRQALEMLGCTHEDDDPGHRCGYCDDYVDRNGTLRAAITKELQ